jgi:hypothetical protein
VTTNPGDHLHLVTDQTQHSGELLISQCLRDEIVLQGPTNCPADLKRFPVGENGRHFSATFFDKRLPNGETVARKWLVYSPSVDKVFCCCCKFEGDRCRSILGTTCMNDWKHLTQAKLLEHESSSAHCKSQHSWIECSTRLLYGSCVDAALQEHIRSKAMHRHGVLKRLLDVTLYLSGRSLAFRGSSHRLLTAENGNFLGLVEMLGKYDDVLKEHLRRVLAKEISDHYCSKRIQDELLELLAMIVEETNLSRVKKSQVLRNHSGLHARRKS